MSNELNQQLSLEQILDNVRWNEAGLVSAIVQDDATLQVLTLAYMNRESLKLSLESGETWFWSRSRQELWHKGATSGNTQKSPPSSWIVTVMPCWYVSFRVVLPVIQEQRAAFS